MNGPLVQSLHPYLPSNLTCKSGTGICIMQQSRTFLINEFNKQKIWTQYFYNMSNCQSYSRAGNDSFRHQTCHSKIATYQHRKNNQQNLAALNHIWPHPRKPTLTLCTRKAHQSIFFKYCKIFTKNIIFTRLVINQTDVFF